MLHPLCNKISTRIGACVCGFINVVIGISGILLVLLDTDGRHIILNPQDRLEYYIQDSQKDTFQFFLEFWMPSLSLLLVGIVVILASTLSSATKRTLLATLAFVLSTIQLAGFIAGLFALLISGVNRLGVLPFLFVTILQFYFHWVIAHFSQFAWNIDATADTQELIDPATKDSTRK